MPDRLPPPESGSPPGPPELDLRGPLSLRLQLFLLLGAFALLPLLVTNAWGYLQTRSYLTAAALRNAGNVAALEASETLEFARSRRELLRSIPAGNRYLLDLLDALESTPEAGERAGLLDKLHDHLAAKATETKATDRLLVLDSSGRLLATSAESEHPPSAKDLVTCSASDVEGRLVGEDEEEEEEEADHQGEEHLEPMFVSTVAIRKGGQNLGTLCGLFSFNVHRELVRAHRERTTDADLFLVDGEGHRMCGSADDPEMAFEGEVHPQALAVVQRGLQWTGRYDSPATGPVIAAYAPIPELDWGVLVELPETMALASIERLKWQALIIGTLFIALVLPAMAGTARATARPLPALADAARRLAAGGPGEQVAETGALEMVQLARSFNYMSGALQEARQHLEARITERTQELQRSQEFTELLLDSIEQRVLVIDRDLRVVKANRAAERLHGPDLVGAAAEGGLAGTTPASRDCPIHRVFDSGQPMRSEATERTLRGQDIFQLDSFPVRSGSGEIEAVVQIGRVVTGEKRLLAQTMHQEKMAALGLLAAGLAHEIGNPLASIESQLRLVRELPDSDRAKETLPIVEREVRRIAGLLRELTDLARRKRDEVVLVSIDHLVEDVARLLGHDPRCRGVRIVPILSGDVPGVRAKEDHLVQVLLNLGLNAIDAMASGGGTLRLVTLLEEGQAVIRVEDTGSGIPEATLARLFEPFLTTKEPGRGTGLGLFVSLGLVEGLGGTLTLEETGPGGTVFAIRLPLEGAR